MSNFKIGDIVKIDCPYAKDHGKEGIIDSEQTNDYIWIRCRDGVIVNFNVHYLVLIEDSPSFIVSGATSKPHKEWHPDTVRDDVDIMDVTRGLLG